MVPRQIDILVQYDELGDGFHTNGIKIGDVDIDSISSRNAMMSIVNVLKDRNQCFVGDLSLLIGMSIKRTETILKHLMNINVVNHIDDAKFELVSLRR